MSKSRRRQRPRPHQRRHPAQRARAPRTWPEIVARAMSDPMMAPFFNRLRWTFFAAPDQRYLDPACASKDHVTAADARFIEWALLDHRPTDNPDAPSVLEAWWRDNGWTWPPAEAINPWLGSVAGAFTLDLLDSDARTGILRSHADGRTFATADLGRLHPHHLDLIVGRLLPDEDGRTWHLSPSTVLAPEWAREQARRLRSARRTSVSTVAEPAFSGSGARAETSNGHQVESEFWMGATPFWPQHLIAEHSLFGEFADFLEDMNVDLSPTYLLRELIGLEHPLPVWMRLIQDTGIHTPVEATMLASFVTATWVTATADVLDRYERMDDRRASEWFVDTAFGLVTTTAERARAAARGEHIHDEPLPPPSGDVWQPSPDVDSALRALPPCDEVWTGDRRITPLVRVAAQGLPEFWHAIVWGDEEDGHVLAFELCPPDAPNSALWDVLARAMLRPATGSPRRPTGAICTRIQDAARAQSSLSVIGVKTDVSYESGRLDSIFADELASLEDDPDYQYDTAFATKYLRLPGNTTESVHALHEAVADLYQRQPWTMLDPADLVMVHVDNEELPRLAAWTGGPDVESNGLVVYRNAWALADAIGQEPDDDDAGPGYESFQITFPRRGPDFDRLFREANAHGWPLARGRYAVLALATAGGHPPRLVCGEETGVATAVVAALSRLIERHGPELEAGESGYSVQVETCGHRVRVEIPPNTPAVERG